MAANDSDLFPRQQTSAATKHAQSPHGHTAGCGRGQLRFPRVPLFSCHLFRSSRCLNVTSRQMKLIRLLIVRTRVIDHQDGPLTSRRLHWQLLWKGLAPRETVLPPAASTPYADWTTFACWDNPAPESIPLLATLRPTLFASITGFCVQFPIPPRRRENCGCLCAKGRLALDGVAFLWAGTARSGKRPGGNRPPHGSRGGWRDAADAGVGDLHRGRCAACVSSICFLEAIKPGFVLDQAYPLDAHHRWVIMSKDHLLHLRPSLVFSPCCLWREPFM